MRDRAAGRHEASSGHALAGRPARPLIALFGPTAIGKTEVAVELAELLRGQGEEPLAISADALQVYRGLETLTAAPTPDQLARLPHRLVSFVPVTERFSVGEYMPLAHRAIDAALAAGQTPIVVGGTGLYLRAALCELDLRPPPPPGLRERLERELAVRGSEALHAELAQHAPGLARRIPPRDRSRVLRALELIAMGADPEPVRGAENRLWTDETRLPTILVGLTMERAALYRRIDERSERIFAAARAEVLRADAAGASRTAREAIGFEELLRGDLEGMKRASRRLAKAQLTWMRKLRGVTVIDVTSRSPREVAQIVLDRVRRAQRG